MFPRGVWREEDYGQGAVRREMERRGEQITALPLLFQTETVRCLYPILTESMETEPPSNPSTGKPTSSPSLCCAIT